MAQKWTTWLLVFTFLLVLGSYWQLYVLNRMVSGLSDQLEQLTPQIKEREMSTTYTALVNGSPQPHTVTDTQRPGESDADFTLRHYQHILHDQANGYPIYHP